MYGCSEQKDSVHRGKVFPSFYAEFKEVGKMFVMLSRQIPTFICQLGKHPSVAEETSFHHDDSGHASTLTLPHRIIRAEETQTFEVGHSNLVLKIVGKLLRLSIESLQAATIYML